MAGRALSILLSLLLLVYQTWAQIGPDSHWLSPDGSKTDFTTTWSAGAGKSIKIQWTAGLNDSSADLWISHWSQKDYPWNKSITRNLDLSTDGSFTWDADVPTSEIQANNQFVFRFFPRNAVYGILQFAQKSSPGFYLTGGTPVGGGGTTSGDSSQSTQSTGTTSSTRSATTTDSGSSSQSTIPTSSFTTIVTTTNSAGSVITATLTTSVPSPTSSAFQTTPSSLSLAGQTGIGVGAGVFIIVLFVAGCFFGRRFGGSRALRHGESDLTREAYPMLQSNQTIFISGRGMAAGDPKSLAKPQTSNFAEDAKLVSRPPASGSLGEWRRGRTPWVEIEGNNSYAVEKGGAVARPGVHEIG